MTNPNLSGSKKRLGGSQTGSVINVPNGTPTDISVSKIEDESEFDDELPPSDVLEEIEEEFNHYKDESFEVCLGSTSRRGDTGHSYGEEMTKYAMTTLRKIVYVKNKYTKIIKEAKKRALDRSNREIVGLTNDMAYIAERLEAQVAFQEKIDGLSALLLKPEQIKSIQKPLTAPRVHSLSEAYRVLMFTTRYLPFEPRRNEYLMRVKKSVTNTNDRAVLAAGLSMINYYSGQEVKVPYHIHLFEGHDAIRMAGVITRHTIKKGVVEYSDIKSCARWYWPEIIFVLNHQSLPTENKPYMEFLLCHMLVRLIFTDVIEGYIKPIKTVEGNYQAGLYFTVGPKYLKQKSL